MPASNEEFIKKAFESGLTEDQVRAAVAERNSIKRPQIQQQEGILNKVTDFLVPRTKEFLKSHTENLQNASFGEKLYESVPVLNLLTNLENGKVTLDKEGLGAAGEVGAYLMPGNKLLKGGNALTKVAGGALQGGEIGALLGLTNPEAGNVGERVKSGVTQGVTGAVTGGAVQGLFEVGKAGLKTLVGDAAQKLNKIIRPNPSSVDKFKQNTGMDFAKEIVKRDAKNIEGMNYPDLEKYFGGKYQEALGKVDDELAKSNETISKDWLKKQFTEVVDLYKDRPAVSEKIGQQFETYFKYLDKIPEDVPLSVANQIKRDLQELASSAYGNTSNSVPKAYQKIAARLNKEITRIYPKAAELNKETQLYRLVSDAVKRTSSREQNKISTSFMDKLLQTIPSSAGLGVGFLTHNPLAGIGTALAGAGASKAREVYRSPEVQTRLASMISSGVSPRLQALSRVLGNTVRKGASIYATR